MPSDFFNNVAVFRRAAFTMLLFVMTALSCLFLYRAADSVGFRISYYNYSPIVTQVIPFFEDASPSLDFGTRYTLNTLRVSLSHDALYIRNQRAINQIEAFTAYLCHTNHALLASFRDLLYRLHTFMGYASTFRFSLLISEEYSLERVLKDASMEDNSVILTTLNDAWAAPNSVIDLFLESFRIGQHTRHLLNHLVIITLDQKAFSRCLVVHSHCVALITEGVDFSREAYFMRPNYVKMMWRRIDFLRSVLEMGYNFAFTDADVMWFRDPFPHFQKEADFQIACDHFSGNFDDLENKPNGGFIFVRSNNRSVEFYKFWYSSRERYPRLHDQDVLNRIKYDTFILEIGLRIKFLDTAYFGGFCEPSRDLNRVCTMHANCCFGLDSKLHDLRILLEDWKHYLSLPPSLKQSMSTWRVPQNCSLDSLHLEAEPSMDERQILDR